MDYESDPPGFLCPNPPQRTLGKLLPLSLHLVQLPFGDHKTFLWVAARTRDMTCLEDTKCWVQRQSLQHRFPNTGTLGRPSNRSLLPREVSPQTSATPKAARTKEATAADRPTAGRKKPAEFADRKKGFGEEGCRFCCCDVVLETHQQLCCRKNSSRGGDGS